MKFERVNVCWRKSFNVTKTLFSTGSNHIHSGLGFEMKRNFVIKVSAGNDANIS